MNENLLIIPFIISFLIMFCIFLVLIIKYYSGFSEYEYIWFCSKILTVKKMIEKNNNKDQVFHEYKEGLPYSYNNTYLTYLERIDNNKDCLADYKKCGILDTYGNSCCILKNSDCVINEIKYDSTSQLSEYINNNYDYYNFADDNNMKFYFKKGVENNGVIVLWLLSNGQPKYINENNFIFDKEAFDQIFSEPSDKAKDIDDDDDDDDDEDGEEDSIGSEIGKEIISGTIEFVGDLIENAVKMARIEKLIKYINNKIDSKDNIDYNFLRILNSDEYVKNYIGFENLEAAENFKRINFNLYKSRYPNYVSLVFSIICLIIFFVIIIIYIILIVKDEAHSCFCFFMFMFILIYCPTFIGFFIYSLVIYSKFKKDESIEIAKNIRADKYIEDFLKEFYDPLESAKSFIIYIVIFLSFSALLHILGWVLPHLINYIIEKKREKEYNEKRITYEYQRNTNINQGRSGRVPYNSQNDNGNQIIINSNRGLNNEQLVTNDNQNPNNNNKENNIINKEKENEENKKNEKIENPITDINDLIIDDVINNEQKK